MADPYDRLRELCAGREEWHIRKGDSITMWFTYADSTCPERDAHEWLDRNQRNSPARFAGYEVVKVIEQTELQQLALATLDSLQVEAAAAEASIGNLSRLVDELRADSERLEWVLRRCHGTWLRAYLGVVSDTGDMETLRTLIDANRGALSSAHGIKGDSHA